MQLGMRSGGTITLSVNGQAFNRLKQITYFKFLTFKIYADR